ncbi:hypothetical protein HYY74_00185 [Candidatus Woesearchaeota archaeon]|nr:hypothetical protein [Candidatus Woesearchaeota archaeon]
MMSVGKRVSILVFVLLVSVIGSFSVSADPGDNFPADRHVWWITASIDKNTFGLNESIPLSGQLRRMNISNTRANSSNSNNTEYHGAPANIDVNISILNSSTNATYTLLSQILVTTAGNGIFRSKSDNYPGAVALYAPTAEGIYTIRVEYIDSVNGTVNRVHLTFNVFSKVVDKMFVSPEKSVYYGNDQVVLTSSAWRSAGDSLVPVANVTINGTVRRGQGVAEVLVNTFSCVTGDSGSCQTNFTASNINGRYFLEVNSFVATGSFQVIPFDVSVYIRDTSGTTFKEILTTNEQAAVEVKVTRNGTAPNGSFVFNGSIVDVSGRLVANITSTDLNDTNGFVNRWQFTTGNMFTDGAYKASVTVYQNGASGNMSAATFFQVRGWTLSFVKAAENSGFEYEYTTFPGRNLTFEVYPKERSNGSLISVVNDSHFNITLYNSMKEPLSSANITLNSSCGNAGCFKFSLVAPNVTGSYIVSVTLNFSDVVQTSERTIKVTDITATSYPSTQTAELKELFSTTESLYISFTAKNSTSSVNVTNVTLGSFTYENGTLMNYTRVGGWDQVNSNNSVLEWAFNSTSSRVMMDVPKQGGAYSAKFYVNNNSATASTSLIVNPYDSCAAAKSGAGSVDSSSSWYVWQYKSTDTVYIELRLSRAENPVGRAPAENSTNFDANQYGMGKACYVDTTRKQVITNATVTVDKVVNTITGSKQALNTTATLCSADNDQGQYTCIIKPESKWAGGRSMVLFKIVGPDSQTTDRASTIFESRSFYMWAYANNYAWVQKPVSNITFNVRLYEAGSNWWSNWYSNSQNGGITGSVSVERVNFMGDYGEWIWPPVDYKYNVSGLNSSNVTSGWGSFTIYHDRTPKMQWSPGTYSVTIKGTNDANGDTDYGEAWFNVRKWEAYSTPVDGNYNYKYSFGSKENVSLYIRIYNAGSYSDTGGASLGGNVTVGVKKIQFYKAGSYKELNQSLYSVRNINVNTSSPWYYGASDTYRNHIMNISRTTGGWDSGWYSVILDINGSETGYGWFNVIAFNVDTQPTNRTGSYTYTSVGTNPVYFNISTTKSKKNSYSWYERGDYINTTIKDMIFRTWRSDTWESVEFNYPEELNITPLSVNGTANSVSGLVAVNKTSGWESGYYSGEVTMLDAENQSASGYLWFSVQPFRLSASMVGYTVDTDANASINLNVYQPDWSNNNLVYGNYSVSSVTETLWSGSGYSKITYGNYRPNSSQFFNATTQLNITPNSGAWSSANGGYRYVTLKVVDNAGGSSQTTSVSFRAVSVTVSIGAIANRYSVTSSSNVTIPITVTKSASGRGSVGNISKVYEWSYPYQTIYNVSVGGCNTAQTLTCMVNSTPAGGSNGSVTQNVTLIVPSGGWSEGWHSINLDFTSATDASARVDGGYAWFFVTTPYSAYWYNENENASWQYYFGTQDNVTFRLQVMNSSYGCGNAFVNVSSVEVAASDNSCWSDYCRKWYSYNFTVFNQSASWISSTSISAPGNTINCTERRGIRILNNGTPWTRGQYYIRVNVNGSQGSAVLKTGYYYVKDTAAPNATIHSPAFNATINGSLFFNATTTEAANCYVYLMNYDQFASYYCYSYQVSSNSSNTTTQDTKTQEFRSCNNTAFNGSNYYYAYATMWYNYGVDSGSFTTGGTSHTVNFSISRLPATQDYAIDIWCYDEDWNYVNRKVAFRVNMTNVTVAGGSGNGTNATVNLSLIAPADGADFTVGSELNLSFMLNHTFGANYNIVGNCSLYANFTGTWALNQTRLRIINGKFASQQSNFNITHSTAGKYMWGVLCNATNSTNASWSLTNRTFTLNDSASNLTVNLSSPANNAEQSTAAASLNVSLRVNLSRVVLGSAFCDFYTNFTGVWAANWSPTLSSADTTSNHTMNFTTNRSILWNAYCYNGSISAWASSNWTFHTKVNNVASLSVNLSSPTNNSQQSTTASSLNVSLRVNLSQALQGTANCSYYTNFTGAWASNATLSSTATTTNHTMNFTTNTSILWNAYCQNGSLSAWASSNFTFHTKVSNVSLDANLSVNLSSPVNNSQQSTTASSLNVTLSVNLSKGLAGTGNCSYYTNFTGAWASNATLSSTATTTNHTMNFTTNTSILWNAYCQNGSLSAWASSNFTFHTTVNNGTVSSGGINVSLLAPTARSGSTGAGLQLQG